MPDRYRVFFHHGQELGLNTHVLKGKAWVDASGLNIQGSTGSSIIPTTEIEKVEMFRLHGLARVIRVDHEGGRLYLSVLRFMIGQFASVNFFKTGELYKLLASCAKPN